MKIKQGLGRGLDALINPNPENKNETPLTIPSTQISQDDGSSFDFLAKIELMKIKPNPFQPRIEFDQQALDELKKSIIENGLIQPVTVRRVSTNEYELISGERRFRACKELGYKTIPAYIIKAETKEVMLALSLIENIQREKLNPIEVANAYKRLSEECNLSQEEISRKVGKDRSTITNSIRLLKLPEEIQQGLIKNQITSGHARALINLPSAKLQLKVFKRIIDEGLTVRDIEKIAQKLSTAKSLSQKKQEIQKDTILRDYESKLRSIFATKVRIQNRKNGAGEIIFDFYSSEEFERLYELFEIVNKNA
ncbi:MAG: ParB/RepB/Spo0J family partition protein [Ignavibacteriales bacterium]